MKRILSLFIVTTFLLFSAAGDCLDWRWYRSSQTEVYRGTVTGLRVSASSNADPLVASGGAFVDGLLTSLVTGDNSTFASNTGFWDMSQTVSITGGVLQYTNGTNGQFARSPLLTIGETYRLTVTVSGYSGGGFRFTDAINISTTWQANGTYSYQFTASATELYLQCMGASSTFNIDNVFVYKIGPTGIDPLFCDGLHQIDIYSSTGLLLRGITKTAGSAESLDAEVATGTCVALRLYKITATEANHYGTGLIVGSYFTSAGTETNDASNKVKQVLAPGTAGSTIVSAKAGATFNWTVNQWVAASYLEPSKLVIIKRLR